MIFYEDFFDNNFFGENFFDEAVFYEFFDENILDKICCGKDWQGGQNWPKARILDGISKK